MEEREGKRDLTAFRCLKEFCGDSYDWMSAFINATGLFSLISFTIYAVGISRQLKIIPSLFAAEEETLGRSILCFFLFFCLALVCIPGSNTYIHYCLTF